MIEKIWTIESNKARNDFLGFVITSVGIVLVIATHKQKEISQNSQAAFALGILLLVIGIFTVLYGEYVLVEVDPNQKRLRIQKTTRFGKRVSIIRFSEIERFYVATIGKQSSHLQSYLLKMVLKNGKQDSLGKLSFNKSDIDEIVEKLTTQIEIKTDIANKKNR